MTTEAWSQGQGCSLFECLVPTGARLHRLLSTAAFTCARPACHLQLLGLVSCEAWHALETSGSWNPLVS